MSSDPRKPTGIKVIIVGAGFGGLTTAIECRRRGHDVVVYENFPELKPLGDSITFGSNGGRIVHRWDGGKLLARLRARCIDLSEYGFRIHKYDTGELAYHQRRPPPDPEAPMFNGHRGELHELVFAYARDECGVDIYLDHFVEDYFEDPDRAGVILEGGERVRTSHNAGPDFTLIEKMVMKE